MKMTKYIISLLTGLAFFISCEKNEDPLLNIKDTNVYFDTDQSRFVPSVSENNSVLKVPIILAGVPGTYPITVTVETDTVGIDNPACEGRDFIIKKKEITFEEGYGQKYVEIRTIDNADKNATRHFNLVIKTASRPLKENVDSRIRISLIDDEHPLKKYFGTYNGSGLDCFTGDPVNMVITISGDPDDDNMVLVQGFQPLPLLAFKLRIDPENNVCSFPGGQLTKLDDSEWETRFCKCYRGEDGFLDWDYEDVPGIISEDGRQFTFTEWVGLVVVDLNVGPEYYGGAYFAYKDFKMIKR